MIGLDKQSAWQKQIKPQNFCKPHSIDNFKNKWFITLDHSSMEKTHKLLKLDIFTETLASLASPSSVDTDMLSSLGVRMKEFPDPLADWEDLEPELEARRSLHVDNYVIR